MWKEPYATFDGERYQVKGAINEPKGVQKPHIPIWIGGGGEKVTLKLVAKYGDACNVGGIDPEGYRHKYDVVKGHCATVGRNYNSIIKSAAVTVNLLLPGQDPEEVTRVTRGLIGKQSGKDVSLSEYKQGNFVGTPQEAVELFKRLVEAGVEYFVVYLNEIVHLETLRLFAAEVMPAFK